MTNRQRIIRLILIVVLLTGIVVAYKVVTGRRSLTVTTVTSPVTFELDDQKYTLTQDHTFSVKKKVYGYRASATVDGKHIVLADKLDFTDTKKITLPLDFSIYTANSVSQALCSDSDEESSSCDFKPQYLRIVYAEHYQWAVVYIDSPTVGQGKAVLKVEDGGWNTVAGPGTDIPSDGYFPASVEEILDAQQ